VKLGFNLKKAASPFKILLINSCQKLAKDISTELSSKIPAANITFAPTITLAKIILNKIHFDIVVSSSFLPDGSCRLIEAFINSQERKSLFFIIKNVSDVDGLISKLDLPSQIEKHGLEHMIQDLGADIRNDINNPLQEIVSMLYVAKSENLSPEVASQALDAIGKAAGNLSSVVKQLEGKIRGVVVG
jgi:hypothetical protein